MPRPVLLRGLCLAALLTGLSAHAGAEEFDEATLERGRALFVAEAPVPCGACHVLADAGTSGNLGPVLHDMKPSLEQVKAAVTDGVGIMPAYADMLSAEDIAAVSAYVAKASGALN